MRIQHNIAALNSHRQLTSNNNAVSKSLEKLSSGFRINRAGDDAAGLAISEKMRAQITGLETAQKNANDGISLIQTAEGALTEVHSMLNRMVELANQSANGVYDNETDRANLQKELNSLKDEINRISEGTNFNGINLLDGSLGGGSNKVAPKVSANWASAPAMTEVAATADTYTGIAAPTGAKGTEGSYEVQYTDADGNTKTTTVKFANASTAAGAATNLAAAINKDSNLSGIFTATANGNNIEFKANEKGTNAPKITTAGGNAVTAPTGTNKGVDAGVTLTATGGNDMTTGDSLTVDGKTYTVTGGTTNAEEGKFSSVDDLVKQLELDGYKAVNYTAGSNVLSGTTITRDPKASGKGLTLQIGDTADSFNQLTVSVGDMSAKSLGIGNIDISTQQGGKDAVKAIKDAINTVSSTRGDLGALQNRLEHTINNLNVSAENMTAAESRIRDVDMAKEMMTYTKNNILVQASQAMLAQANQLPQGVLQLLQ